MQGAFMKIVVIIVTRCKMQQFLTVTWNFEWLLVGYLLFTSWLLAHSLLLLFIAAFNKVPNERRH